MRIVLAVLSVAVGITVCKGYASFVRRGRSQLRGFILLLRRIRERIGCYLESPAESVRGWECPELDAVGIVSLIGAGTAPLDALEQVRGELLLPRDALAALEALFRELGGGYMEDELRRIDSAVNDLSGILDRVMSEGEKSVKGTSATVMAVAVGIAIFVI